MDENPHQNNEEDLSARLRGTKHVLKELRNSRARRYSSPPAAR